MTSLTLFSSAKLRVLGLEQHNLCPNSASSVSCIFEYFHCHQMTKEARTAGCRDRLYTSILFATMRRSKSHTKLPDYILRLNLAGVFDCLHDDALNPDLGDGSKVRINSSFVILTPSWMGLEALSVTMEIPGKRSPVLVFRQTLKVVAELFNIALRPKALEINSRINLFF